MKRAVNPCEKKARWSSFGRRLINLARPRCSRFSSPGQYRFLQGDYATSPEGRLATDQRAAPSSDSPKQHIGAWQARKYTIRRLGCGRRPVARPLHATYTRRRCCRMGRCWWPTASAAGTSRQYRGQKYTIRRAGAGRAPTSFNPGALATRRRCCVTARYLSQEDTPVAAPLARADLYKSAP